MVKVTVLLVRDAETVMEARRRADPDFDEQLDDETVNDDLKAYISDQAGDEAGHGEDGTMTLSERVDPDLADERAYEYAQNAMTDLMNALAKDGNERKLAYFSAPNRSCAATALMMSCADIKNHEHLTWRLSTFEGASAPASIPIVVSNGLCNAEPQAMRLGGYKATVEGGLMHCAAMPFNDGRTKCPLMKVFKRMKEKTAARVDDWDEARDDTGKKIHYVNYVQFMRIENPSDPWSLTEMVPKINLVVEFVEPKRYMLPPRKGMFTPKKHYKEWKEGVEPYVKDTVVQARNAGCDTVIMVVPASCMKEMARTVLGRDVENSPCCVATLVADVASADSVSWTWHGFATADSLKNNVALIPSFTGPIDALYHPHEGKDPSDAPANKWAAFPEPEPEVLPANYPDLPPFSMSLDEPLPNIPKKKPVTSKKKKPKSSKSQSKPKRAS